MSDGVDVHVEKVAEAIWKSRPKPTPWGSTEGWKREIYLEMARAAIEALQLTKEWAVAVVYPPRDDYPGAVVRQAGPYAFQEAAEIDKRSRYSDDCYTIASRLVGPWCAGKSSACHPSKATDD